MTGPGAVMVGLAVGSGEMVLWPWITAKFGAGMAWAAVLGIFVQVWVNFEVGRWAVATGESALTGFARVSSKFIYLFMAILISLAFLPSWARATGVIIRYLLFGLEEQKTGADWQWTILVYGCVFALLFGPKRIYATIERVVSVMVFVIVIGMITVVIQIGSMADVAELGRGLLNFGHITLDNEFTFMRFFGAMVFVGAGGFGQLYYAYYLRDKGIGMGAQIPELTSALRDKGATDTEIGYRYRDNPENARRFRDWFSYVKQDNILFFFLLNTFVAGERRQVRPREAVLHSSEFKALWERIKHKTTYRVHFDNGKLVQDCIQALRDAPTIPRTRLQWRKAELFASVFHARKIEHVLHQSSQPVALADDEAIVVLRPFVALDPAAHQHLSELADAGQR